jgi:hypothetical protein
MMVMSQVLVFDDQNLQDQSLYACIPLYGFRLVKKERKVVVMPKQHLHVCERVNMNPNWLK